jgi:hypothetical protein
MVDISGLSHNLRGQPLVTLGFFGLGVEVVGEVQGRIVTLFGGVSLFEADALGNVKTILDLHFIFVFLLFLLLVIVIHHGRILQSFQLMCGWELLQFVGLGRSGEFIDVFFGGYGGFGRFGRFGLFLDLCLHDQPLQGVKVLKGGFLFELGGVEDECSFIFDLCL